MILKIDTLKIAKYLPLLFIFFFIPFYLIYYLNTVVCFSWVSKTSSNRERKYPKLSPYFCRNSSKIEQNYWNSKRFFFKAPFFKIPFFQTPCFLKIKLLNNKFESWFLLPIKNDKRCTWTLHLWWRWWCNPRWWTKLANEQWSNGTRHNVPLNALLHVGFFKCRI